MGESSEWAGGHSAASRVRPDRDGGRTAFSGSPASRREPDLPPELAFLAAAGMHGPTIGRLWRGTRTLAATPEDALIASGAISREIYDEALAAHVGAGWSPGGPTDCGGPGDPPDLDADGRIRPLPLIAEDPDGVRRLYLSPEATGAGRLLAMTRERPQALRNCVFTSSLALRTGHGRRMRSGLVHHAAFGLDEQFPEFSARTRMTAAQMVVIAGAVAALAVAAFVAGRPAMLATGALFTAYYLASVLLRVEFLRRLGDQPATATFAPKRDAAAQFPVYSIMVALYREAGQVAGLTECLKQIDWPEHRLEVLLVCEEDDAETIAAAERLDLPSRFCIVKAPAGKPRTKPKALNFALPVCSGEFVVVYDAEDRPHRLQLREAWENFCANDARLACLQAPLAIHNRRQNWFTAMFALEYDTLFRSMLPMLAQMGAPLPLGGTSNHFRASVLRRAGGWDAWNVTEDADAGIRLARLGYRCGTITLPTWEEAPPSLPVWLRQRTRWFKGWIQTILVHTRSPARLHRELGRNSHAIFHLFLTCVVVSALVHPLFLLHTLWQAARLASGDIVSAADGLITALAIFNFIAGYTVYAALARETAQGQGIGGHGRLLATLPVYWLLLSAAAWRAVWQFAVAPFRWEKTQHGLANAPDDANMRLASDIDRRTACFRAGWPGKVWAQVSPWRWPWPRFQASPQPIAGRRPGRAWTGRTAASATSSSTTPT